MRLNEPVTQRNFEFPSERTLVSVTDLKGRITYCNKSFVAVSGYTEDELLGQPHNLLRHPDMPAEAFRDMWDHSKQGQALVGSRKEPPQEWGPLLGARECDPYPRRQSNRRLFVSSHHADGPRSF
jgi:PAS domain S-box-containing protein